MLALIQRIHGSVGALHVVHGHHEDYYVQSDELLVQDLLFVRLDPFHDSEYRVNALRSTSSDPTRGSDHM